MAWFSRLRAMFRTDKLAQEHEEELDFHLAMREEWTAQQGVAREEARRDAHVRLGSKNTLRERMSEIDLMQLPQTIWQDLRYGARLLARNFGFTIAAVLALSIGIGANTAAFTAYKAFFERALEGHDTGRVVNIALNLQSGNPVPWLSLPDFEAYRANVHALSGMTTASNPDILTLTGAGGVALSKSRGPDSLVNKLGILPYSRNAETTSVLMVANNYFTVLGVNAIRGRVFSDNDKAETDSTLPALISENYWQKRFAGDPSILGRTFRMNGIAFTIVGVTPHNFVGTLIEVPDFWLPMSAEPLLHPADNWLRDRENLCCRVWGRLAPGATMESASAELSAVAEHLRSLHTPGTDLAKPVTAVVWPGSPFPLPIARYGGMRYVLFLILGAVGVVLLIACANVACLQLARAASRQNELSMRLSLGASRMRMIRQLLTESALLGVLSGVVALLLSWAFLQAIVVFAAEAFPTEYGTFIFHVAPNMVVFGYVFCISLIAGVLFGLAPALESSGAAVASALKANQGTSPGRRRWTRDALMAVQVAFSLMLLIAGSMLIRASLRTLTMDSGFDIKHGLQLNFQFPDGARYNATTKGALISNLRSRLAAAAGVAAITSGRAPDAGGLRTAAISLDGQPPSAKNTRAVLFFTYVRPNYFQALGIPILFGRGFETQGSEPEPVIVLSESAAQQLWPGQNAVGRSLRLGTDSQFHLKGELQPDGRAYEVVGVSRDTRGVLMDNSDAQQVYVPMPDSRAQDYPLLIRSQGDPAQCLQSIASVLASIDPDVVVTASTLEDLLLQTPSFAISSLSATIAIAVGLLGLLLASMGIYGTVSYMVVLRTREVGIRMALGAKKRHVLLMILRDSARPVAVGLIAGMVLAAGASLLLRKVLYGLSMIDGVSFGGVALLFIGIALLASYLPSRRAMRVDPMVALRYD